MTFLLNWDGSAEHLRDPLRCEINVRSDISRRLRAIDQVESRSKQRESFRQEQFRRGFEHWHVLRDG